MPSFFLWNLNPDIFHLGPLPIRWYGLLFVITFIIAPKIASYIYKIEGKPQEDIEVGVIHIMIGTLLGARLGHVIFYQFSYFINHPLEAILPFTFYPHFRLVGYRGLASHGAAIGIILSLIIFTKFDVKFKLFPLKFKFKRQNRKGQSFLWVSDRAVIFVALAGMCIRLGNFANSEIYGIPTTKPFGVVFGHRITEGLKEAHGYLIKSVKINRDKSGNKMRQYMPLDISVEFNKNIRDKEGIESFVNNDLFENLKNSSYFAEHIKLRDSVTYEIQKKPEKGYIVNFKALGIPRHASQLYESLSCLILFIFLFLIWKNKWRKIKNGTMAGIFLLYIFGLRFFYEFLKTNNIPFPKYTSLTTPQLLSILGILTGMAFLIAAQINAKKKSD